MGKELKALKQGPIRIAAPIFKLWISSRLEGATATKGGRKKRERRAEEGRETGVQIIGLSRSHDPLCATTGQVLLFLLSSWGARYFCHRSPCLFTTKGMFGDSRLYLSPSSSVPFSFLSVAIPQDCLVFHFPLPFTFQFHPTTPWLNTHGRETHSFAINCLSPNNSL
ncbi:hypothetical protein An13g00145 [Aspergillus niger]|uniref:Uncharacterized protein n=2 Tax=Aspergillus niger TaxID=5061 RepID=A2R167_ASPNC|nr:hypothetical protein An13g00145 [Aspergillus niger]CAK46417.1 hypothetical protein An13g00145 [Aspergillus niger]